MRYEQFAVMGIPEGIVPARSFPDILMAAKISAQ
jgi:hypothetical protein